jgi:hypothetical protein
MYRLVYSAVQKAYHLPSCSSHPPQKEAAGRVLAEVDQGKGQEHVDKDRFQQGELVVSLVIAGI